MASSVRGAEHPVSVLATKGWEIPSSGECALYTTICSPVALDDFCSLLLSARFGSADALLDLIGRVNLDSVVCNDHASSCSNPSDQGQSSTCYAHTVAAVAHMALVRIVRLDSRCPTIDEIRARILAEFPDNNRGRSSKAVLKAVTSWYRPLRFREVGEDGARQAVLQRRPVLTTFRLSKPGWQVFSRHFDSGSATRKSTLTVTQMLPYRMLPEYRGHAVILTSCERRSLTFLNSWGNKWGKNGSFSVENRSVLDLDRPEGPDIRFYDTYWNEDDLTEAENTAYKKNVDEDVKNRVDQHPSILEVEYKCPCCSGISPVMDFTGSIREALCAKCREIFAPEPGHLAQALHIRAGLGAVD